jgi:outer membrane protein assembly factor BamB
MDAFSGLDNVSNIFTIDAMMGEKMSKRYILLWFLSLFAVVLQSGLLISCSSKRNQAPLKPVWVVSFSERYIYGENEKLTTFNSVLYCLAASDSSFKDATLYAIDNHTGTILWKDRIHTKGVTNSLSPLIRVADKLVCYQTEKGILRALDSQTGIERWQFSNFSYFLGSSDEQIHIFDSEWQYIIIDATTGKIKAKEAIQGNIPAQVLFTDGYRYLINDKRLSVKDIQMGKLLWTYNSDDIGLKMTTANGVLYVVADNTLTAFDGKTGRKLWQRSYHGFPPIIEGETAYLGCILSDGSDCVLKLNAKTGEDFGSVSAGHWSSARDLIVADGVIYSPLFLSHYSDHSIARNLYGDDVAGSYDYGLTATKADTGIVLWKTELIWGEYSTKPVVANGLIYLGVAAVGWGDSAQLLAYDVNQTPK